MRVEQNTNGGDTETWGELTRCLLKRKPYLRIEPNSTGRKAYTRAAWERWIDARCDARKWVNKENMSRIYCDRNRSTEEAISMWLTETLFRKAGEIFGSEEERARSEAESAILESNQEIKMIAAEINRAMWSVPTVINGWERVGRIHEIRKKKGEDKEEWDGAIRLGELEELGRCKESTVLNLAMQPRWITDWLLEGNNTRDKRWLEHNTEQWLREMAKGEARSMGFEEPKGSERMEKLIQGWPGRMKAPPLMIAIMAKKGGVEIDNDQRWAAAQEVKDQIKPGEGNVKEIAEKVEEKATHALEKVEQRIRRGAEYLYGKDRLARIEALWNKDPTLGAMEPSAPKLEELRNDEEVAWTVDYDTMVRVACGAWARASRLSEEMAASRALRMITTNNNIVGVLENAPRGSEPKSRETHKRIQALRKIEQQVNDKWRG